MATAAPSPAGSPAASADVQELAEIENYAANRFYPNRFVVVRGVQVRLYITRLHLEHINSFSIDPFLKSVAFFPPGTLGVVEFVPDRAGSFRMVNDGHGFEAAFVVVENAEEANAQKTSAGVQEFALVHDFAGSRLVTNRLVVQQGVPVRIFNTALGGLDKVSIAPFYVPASNNVEAGTITVIEFTPTEAGEFPISYERHKLSGVLVVEPRQ